MFLRKTKENLRKPKEILRKLKDILRNYKDVLRNYVEILTGYKGLSSYSWGTVPSTGGKGGGQSLNYSIF